MESLQKAVEVIRVLPDAVAERLLNELPDELRSLLLERLERTEPLDDRTRAGLLEAFLRAASGEEPRSARPALRPPDPAEVFGFLRRFPAAAVADVLSDEKPHIVALALAALSAEAAAEVLACLPFETAQKSIRLRTRMRQPSAEVLLEIAAAIHQRLRDATTPQSPARAGSERAVGERTATDAAETAVAFHNAVVAAGTRLTGRTAGVNAETWHRALRAADPQLVAYVLATLPEPLARDIGTRLDAQPPIRLAEIAQAPRRVNGRHSDGKPPVALHPRLKSRRTHPESPIRGERGGSRRLADATVPAMSRPVARRAPRLRFGG